MRRLNFIVRGESNFTLRCIQALSDLGHNILCLETENVKILEFASKENIDSVQPSEQSKTQDTNSIYVSIDALGDPSHPLNNIACHIRLHRVEPEDNKNKSYWSVDLKNNVYLKQPPQDLLADEDELLTNLEFIINQFARLGLHDPGLKEASSNNFVTEIPIASELDYRYILGGLLFFISLFKKEELIELTLPVNDMGFFYPDFQGKLQKAEKYEINLSQVHTPSHLLSVVDQTLQDFKGNHNLFCLSSCLYFKFDVEDTQKLGLYLSTFNKLFLLHKGQKKQDIQNLIRLFRLIYEAISSVQNLDCSLNDLNLVDLDTIKFLSQIGGFTHYHPPQAEETIISAISKNIKNYPDHIAIEYSDQSLTYEALGKLSVHLSKQISKKLGPVKSAKIILCVERGINLVATILAIWRLGHAYVPVALDFPEERMLEIIQQLNEPLIITDHNRADFFTHYPNFINLSTLALEKRNDLDLSQEELMTGISGDDLAYIIYTSGSTGAPKGVMMHHKGALNMIQWTVENYPITSKDKVIQMASFAFDFSVWEMMSALTSAACLVLTEEKKYRDPRYLVNLIREKQITILGCVTSLFRYLLDEPGFSQCTSLKRIVVGAEPLTLSIKNKLYEIHPHVTLYHGYGPTETAITSVHWECPNTYNHLDIPIGKPIANTKVAVVSESLKILPPGLPGELLIGGIGVGRGYLNQSDLTNQKFIHLNILGDTDLFYRTGDIVRWSGNHLIFVGRKDQMIKLHGLRIELEEIEKAMESLAYIKAAAVKFHKNEKRASLIGYFIVEPSQLTKNENLTQKHLNLWKNFYDDSYKDSHNRHETTFNTVGWKSTFTNQEYSSDLMKEWRDEIVELILGYNPNNVLEIGCGTGLIYHALKGKIKKYIGIDYAQVIIDRMLSTEAAEIELGKSNFFHCSANKIEKIKPLLDNALPIDCVVINSVVQYFPSTEFLENVLDKIIKYINPNYIVLGDILDFRTNKLFYEKEYSVKKELGHISLSKTEFIQNRLKTEKELFIHPVFFIDFAKKNRALQSIGLFPKMGVGSTEMNQFRYNVVLSTQHGSKIKANSILCKNPLEIKKQIQTQALIKTDNHWLNCTDGSHHTRRLPKEIQLEMKQSGLDVNIVLDPLTPEYLYIIKDENFGHLQSLDSQNLRSEGKNVIHYSNVTSLLKEEVISKVIFEDLQKKLPHYMIPSLFKQLEVFPMTSSGKVDKKRLPTIIELEAALSDNPEEAKLQKILSEAIGIKSIGIDENFFSSGGNSLSAINAVYKITENFDVDFFVKDLFEFDSAKKVAQFIKDNRKNKVTKIKKQPFERYSDFLLTHAQNRLWFLHKLDEQKSSAYNVPLLIKLNGHLNIKKLKDSINTLISKHDALRLIFIDKKGIAFQKILEKYEIELPVVDFPSHQATLKGINDVINQPFKLDTTPPIRFTIFTKNNLAQYLVIVIHNIITDGWSMSLLIDQLYKIYNDQEEAFQAHNPLGFIQEYLPFTSNKPKSYYLEGINYWKEYLNNFVELNFPYPYKNVKKVENHLESKRETLSGETISNIYQVASHYNVSPFAIIKSTFAVLLNKYTQQEDIVFGSVLSNRELQSLKDVIGFMVNTVVFRYKLDEATIFKDLIVQAQNSTRLAYSYQDIPFEDVVKQVTKSRCLNKTPIFQFMFISQDVSEINTLKLGECYCKVVPSAPNQAMFAMTFNYVLTKKDLKVDIYYDASLFSPTSIDHFLANFFHLLKTLLNNPLGLIEKVSIVSEHERNLLLTQYNPKPDRNLVNKLVYPLFHEAAYENLDRIACLDETGSTTYKALLSQVNKFSNILSVPTNVATAAIISTPGILSTALALACLKCGITIVFIDPSLPASRIEYMLKASKTDILFSHELNNAITIPKNIQCYHFAHDETVASTEKGFNIVKEVTPDHCAYIVFTSGTTGAPKAVQVLQRNLANAILHFRKVLNMGQLDKVLSMTRPSFDIFYLEMLLPIISGSSVQFMHPDLSIDPSEIIKNISNFEPTLIQATPSRWELIRAEYISKEKNFHVPKILTGGEPLSHQLLTFLYSQSDLLLNVYGPSETTIWSTEYKFGNVSQIISIGKPISNTECYILDKHKNIIPINAIGELYIGGEGVTKGYLNDTLKNKAAFFNIRLDNENKYLYKTGDLASWDEEGNLLFHGRVDKQIKIRGYRIEPGEILFYLKKYPSVEHAHVLFQKDQSTLCAFIKVKKSYEDQFNTSQLNAFLKQELPEYMIPSHYYIVENIPLSVNGKVDEFALNNLREKQSYQEVKNIKLPSNDLQSKLCTIWQNALNIDEFSVDSSFYELGGHSLLAPKIVWEINAIFGCDLTIRNFITNNTIEKLAIFIKDRQVTMVASEVD